MVTLGDPLQSALRAAGSGLHAQSRRINVVSENIANAESTGRTPGADPYKRKTLSFDVDLDGDSGVATVKADQIGTDRAPFRIEHMPGHPAADKSGNVKLPNVDVLMELADMREANRSYQANLQVIKQAREMIAMTVDLLRGTS